MIEEDEDEGGDGTPREIRVDKMFYVRLVELLKPEERAMHGPGIILLSPFGQTLLFVPEGE
jgi:hypothetical protein